MGCRDQTPVSGTQSKSLPGSTIALTPPVNPGVLNVWVLKVPRGLIHIFECPLALQKLAQLKLHSRPGEMALQAHAVERTEFGFDPLHPMGRQTLPEATEQGERQVQPRRCT